MAALRHDAMPTRRNTTTTSVDGPGPGPAATTLPWESPFALLQKNGLDRQRWTTREQPRLAIITWIERTRRRRQGDPGRARRLIHPLSESTKTAAVPHVQRKPAQVIVWPI
jgi:putative transposase